MGSKPFRREVFDSVVGQNTVALHPKGKAPAVDCGRPYACGAEMRYDRMGRLMTRGEGRNKEVISHSVT